MFALVAREASGFPSFSNAIRAEKGEAGYWPESTVCSRRLEGE
jgi:hypothetical protein